MLNLRNFSYSREKNIYKKSKLGTFIIHKGEKITHPTVLLSMLLLKQEIKTLAKSKPMIRTLKTNKQKTN